jgi:Contractile injection system tube protein
MLEKLKILAYSDENLTEGCGQYTVQINPETYKQQLSTEFTRKETLSTQGVVTKFVTQQPPKIWFDFYLDATGVVGKNIGAKEVSSVTDEIKKFNDVVYKYNGSIHSPNYLKVLWGALSFECRMSDLKVEYPLFAPSGVPLRAMLSPTFEQYISPKKLALKAANSSPDLTHYRIVAAGDTLPLMCHRIYRDSKYYVEVARVNGLIDFRNLEPGQRIFFPPLGD